MVSDIQKIYPLIIKDSGEIIIDVSISNEKGFNKSLERGILWHLHADTGRLLPYSEINPLIKITRHHSWFEAVLKKEPSPTSKATYTSKGGQVSREQVSSPEEITGASISASEILGNLEKVILERKQTLKEGSYTTHLFNSGGEKIRKKTGEEAVELILAADKDSIVYEAADLVYHMMVLLASENIELGEVLHELSGRFS